MNRSTADEPRDDELKALVENIEDLPTLPAVVTRIVGMVEDPNTSAEDVNEVISQDPALTAKILKLVNSAFYGFSRRISTVTEAVVILGFNTVKSLALSASVFEVFEGEGSEHFDRVGLWEHSIATGVAGEMAANRIRYPNVEEVMVAGILHKIGQVVIDQYFHEELTRVIAYAREHDTTMLEAEREILGVGHPRVGGWLAERWNLPAEISAAISYYHDPFEAPEDYRRLPMLIHVGDVLARTKHIGWNPDDVEPEFKEGVWDELGLEKEDIRSILDRLKDKMEDAEVLLEMSESNSEGDEQNG
jgi:HD-like signal output (HDOD) protein